MWTTQPIAPTHVCIPHKSTTVFPGPRLASTAEHKQRVNNIFQLLPQVTFTAQAVIWAWNFNPLNINTWYSTRKNRNLRRAYMQTTAKWLAFFKDKAGRYVGVNLATVVQSSNDIQRCLCSTDTPNCSIHHSTKQTFCTPPINNAVQTHAEELI